MFNFSFGNFGFDFRTLLFVASYVLGLKKSPGLTRKEAEVTRRGLEFALTNQLNWGAVSKDDVEQATPEFKRGWWAHPTSGKVGGFNYTLKSWENSFEFDCQDCWDFNPGFDDSVTVEIPLPKFLGRFAEKHLNCVRSFVERSLNKTCWGEGAVVMVFCDTIVIHFDEDALSSLNNRRAFNTYWNVSVSEGLSCPIN